MLNAGRMDGEVLTLFYHIQLIASLIAINRDLQLSRIPLGIISASIIPLEEIWRCGDTPQNIYSFECCKGLLACQL